MDIRRDLDHLLDDGFHTAPQRGIFVQTGVREVWGQR